MMMKPPSSLKKSLQKFYVKFWGKSKSGQQQLEKRATCMQIFLCESFMKVAQGALYVFDHFDGKQYVISFVEFKRGMSDLRATTGKPLRSQQSFEITCLTVLSISCHHVGLEAVLFLPAFSLRIIFVFLVWNTWETEHLSYSYSWDTFVGSLIRHKSCSQLLPACNLHF